MSTPEKDAVVAEEPKAVQANGETETNEKGNDQYTHVNSRKISIYFLLEN